MNATPGLSPGELDDPWAEAGSPATSSVPLSASPEEEGWSASVRPSTTNSRKSSLRTTPVVTSPLSTSGLATQKREHGTGSPSPGTPTIRVPPKSRNRSSSLLNTLHNSRSGSQSVNLENLDDIDPDVSRPSLKRLTSETERQLWEDSTVSSRGGSFDRERDKEVEVEVIVHQVVPSDSLAGLALRYGIDIATLRKVNKLWPSDPVHVRTSLYVPLDACHPTSGTLVRRTGHVTLVPQRKHAVKSPKRRSANGDAASVLSDETAREPSPELPEAQEVLLGEGEDPLTSATPDPPEEPGAIVLQVIKLPASKLHHYPNSRRRARASASTGGILPRASMDSDGSGLSGLSGGLTSLSLTDAAGRHLRPPGGSAGDGRLFGLIPTSFSDSGLGSSSRDRERGKDEGRFAPLMPRVDGFGPDDEPDTFGSRRGKRVVKLRPPVAAPQKGTGIVGRISDFFNPPPPPSLGVGHSPHRPRGPAARIVSEPVSRNMSRSASPAIASPQDLRNVDLGVELDAKPRSLKGTRSRPRPNKKTD